MNPPSLRTILATAMDRPRGFEGLAGQSRTPASPLRPAWTCVGAGCAADNRRQADRRGAGDRAGNRNVRALEAQGDMWPACSPTPATHRFRPVVLSTLRPAG